MSDASMVVAGAIACLGLAGAGSAFGTGLAAAAAVGSWKKCYAADKPAPFLLLSFVGAPITQTLYGMILMFIMLGKTGVAGAAACDAQAETNQGFTNYLAALGIVETVAIFAMVFALIALGSVK